jgi:hypothetical protein
MAAKHLLSESTTQQGAWLIAGQNGSIAIRRIFAVANSKTRLVVGMCGKEKFKNLGYTGNIFTRPN